MDCLMDQQMNLLMYRWKGIFSGFWTFGKFPIAILVGIFTMNLAEGWMDGTDDRHTDGWMEIQVESHLG